MEDPPPRVGIVDAGRNPFYAFGEGFGMDQVRTIGLNNHNLWIIPHDDYKARFGVHGRRLKAEEKARLQGIDPNSMLRHLHTNTDIEETLGNTIPVPMIGTVIAPLLAAWSDMLRQQLFVDRPLPKVVDEDEPQALMRVWWEIDVLVASHVEGGAFALANSV